MGAVSSNPEPRVRQSTCPETFPRAGAQLFGLAPDCVERPHLLSPKRKAGSVGWENLYLRSARVCQVPGGERSDGVWGFDRSVSATQSRV
jgi:hypothetical protein